MVNHLDTLKSKASTIYELAKIIGNKDLIREIGELEIQLSDIRVSYSALQVENMELKEKIRLLEKESEEPLIYKNGAYFSQKDNFPFCPGCYDNDKKRIRLSRIVHRQMQKLASHICPVCKATYSLTR